MIHIVVRHRHAKPSKWINKWLGHDDMNRVEMITTDAELAGHCKLARERGEPVRFHRCAYDSFPATICSEARVTDIQRLGRDFYVYFADQTVLNEVPQVTPHQGQFWYPA